MDDISTLFQLMAWHHTCDKPLPKSVLNKIYDAIPGQNEYNLVWTSDTIW